jgi:hypothetical protein
MTPENLNIVIGDEKILSMPFDSVVASMTHQFLSNSEDENFISDTYYYIFLNASKQIEKWLLDCIDEDFLNPINLFGDWMQNFMDYTAARNKRLMKDLVLCFSDGSEWTVRIVDILYIKQRKENDYNSFFSVNTDDPIVRSEEQMLEWVQNNCSWEELTDFVIESKRPQPELDYEADFVKCKKKFVDWSEDLSVMDLISGGKNDIVFIEDDDDKPV